MTRAIIAILIAIACVASAAPPGGSDYPVVYSGTTASATRKGEAQFIRIDPTLITPSCTGRTCIFIPSDLVTLLGDQIGDQTDGSEFSDPEWHTGRQVKMGGATSLEIPVQTGTQPTTDGMTRLNDDLDRVEVGSDGTRTLRFMPGYQARVLGGVNSTVACQYAGQVSACNTQDTNGTRDICTWGICTGSEGSGTCTVNYNSVFPRESTVTGPPLTTSAVIDCKTWSHTAGTIILQNATATSANLHYLIIRVREDATFSGTATLSTKGKNAAGSSGGTRVSTTAGKNGGWSTSLYALGNGTNSLGGNTSGTGGAAGMPVDIDERSLYAFGAPFLVSVGGGGGTAPVSGNANAGSITHPPWAGIPAAAGGGGGGGCAGSASGTAGAGGDGGAGIRVEVGGKATLGSGYTFDAMGTDGGANGGGGGGGGVQIIAGEISGTLNVDTGTCTASTPRCCVGGGAGGSSGGNCGAGGAGADNVCFVQQGPR